MLNDSINLPKSTFAFHWKKMMLLCEDAFDCQKVKESILQYKFPRLGGTNLVERRAFCEAELDFFAEVLRRKWLWIESW